MVNRVIVKNSTVAGKRPATNSGKPGELFVNVPDKVIGTFDASGNPIELGPVGATPAVAPFDATHSYVVNDLVANAGKIYRAKVAGVNAWNAANWEDININPAQPVAYYDQTATYSANDLVAYNGKIYSSIAGSVAGVFDATKWTELGATYTLPIATAAALGGVKANAGTAGQYVTGIDATGALTYATPPDVSGIMPYDINKTYALNDLVSYSGKVYAANKAATGAWDATKWNEIGATYTLPAPTATTLGGVKANVGTAGQFVSGVAADGSLTYASVTGGLTYLGNQDLTAAYVAPTTPPNVGSFLTNTGTGRLAPSWAAVMNNPPATVAAGDTAVWDGTHYNHNIGAMTALAAATATTLGGVKANAGTDGQFVNGIASDGSLTYGNVSILPFDATKSYNINDLVSESGKIYRAKVAVSPAAFVSNQWTEIGATQTFTAGSIPFADTGGALTEDNAALFWDKANKRLGVGTKTPTAALDVATDAKINGVTVGKGNTGSNNVALVSSATGSGTITGTGNVVIGGLIGSQTTNNTVIIADGAGNEKCRLGPNGEFMLGTTLPYARFFLYNTTNNTTFRLQHRDTNGSDAQNIYIEDMKSSLTAYFLAGAPIGKITAVSATSCNYGATSDYRLKENVEPIKNAIDRFRKLKPSTWIWKSDGSHGEGFIAHELQEHVPIAVSGVKDAVKKDGSIDAQSVDYGKLTPLLSATLLEALDKIDALEARLAKLENK